MRIKHKLTGDEVQLSYREWDDKYLVKKLDEVYDIIEMDIVMLRLIKKDGQRENYKLFDRDHALRMLKSNPMDYDFIDIDGGKIEEGKRVEIENPRFKIISKEPLIKWTRGLKRTVIAIIVSGLGGLLTFFLIKMFS